MLSTPARAVALLVVFPSFGALPVVWLLVIGAGSSQSASGHETITTASETEDLRGTPAPWNEERPAEKPAFEGIVSKHGAWMRSTLAACGVRSADLDDVLQEVLRGVARGLPAFEPSGSAAPDAALCAWLLAICKRQAAHHHREKRRRREDVRETQELDGFDSGSPSAEERILSHEHHVRLREALDELSSDRRAVIVAHDLEGVAMAQVALACGIPINTAWNRLRLAREDVRAALRRSERAGRR